MYVRMCACMCSNVYVCLYVCLSVRTYACLHACMHACMCAYMYVRMHVQVCTYAHTYILGCWGRLLRLTKDSGVLAGVIIHPITRCICCKLRCQLAQPPD